jgi:hypothetical protein
MVEVRAVKRKPFLAEPSVLPNRLHNLASGLCSAPVCHVSDAQDHVGMLERFWQCD